MLLADPTVQTVDHPDQVDVSQTYVGGIPEIMLAGPSNVCTACIGWRQRARGCTAFSFSNFFPIQRRVHVFPHYNKPSPLLWIAWTSMHRSYQNLRLRHGSWASKPATIGIFMDGFGRRAPWGLLGASVSTCVAIQADPCKVPTEAYLAMHSGSHR